MQQRMKRRLAALLSVSLVLGLTVPAYADQADGAGQETYTVKVENVPGGYIEAWYDNDDGSTTVLPIGETVTLPAGTLIELEGNSIETEDWYSYLLGYEINGNFRYGSFYEFELEKDMVISGDFIGTTDEIDFNRLYFETKSTNFYTLQDPTTLEENAVYPLYHYDKNGNFEKISNALNSDDYFPLFYNITDVRFTGANGSHDMGSAYFSLTSDGDLEVHGPLNQGKYQIEYSVNDRYSLYLDFYYGYTMDIRVPLATFEGEPCASYYLGSGEYALDPSKKAIDYTAGFADENFLAGHEFSGFTTSSGAVLKDQTVAQLSTKRPRFSIYGTYKGYTPVELQKPEFFKDGWNKIKDRWYYYSEEYGDILYSTIIQDGDSLYFVDGTGVLATDRLISVSSTDSYGGEKAKSLASDINATYNRCRLYADKDGKLQRNKLIKTSDGTYFAKDNYILAYNELAKTSDGYYFFDYDSKAFTDGFKYVETKDSETKRYYFGKDGKALTSQWKFIDENGSLSLYHFTKDGSVQTEDEASYGGNKYTFDADGSAVQQLTDKQLEAIASPSTASNAAREAKSILEKGINGNAGTPQVTISQDEYGTEEDALGFLQKLIDYLFGTIEEEAHGALEKYASPSNATYVAPVEGTKDNPNGKDGSISQEVEFYHYSDAANDGFFIATTSVAVKIKATPYVEEKTEPETPGQPENPDQPEKPATPSTPNKGNGGSTIGGSGSGSRSSVSTQVTSGSAAGHPETPGAWFFNAFGQWQLLDPNGVPYKDTWVVRNGHWYYVNTDGIMLITWQFLGGKWYYFTVNASEGHPAGSLLTNATTPDGYKVGADGAWIQ